MEILKNKSGEEITAEDGNSMQDVMQRLMNGHTYHHGGGDALNQDEGLKSVNLHPVPTTIPTKVLQSASAHQLPFATLCNPPPAGRGGVTKLAGGNITMLDTRMSREDRLKNRFKLSCQEISKGHKRSSTDDPYAFMDNDAEPSKTKKLLADTNLKVQPPIVASVTSSSKTGVSQTQEPKVGSSGILSPVAMRPSSSIAKLYPQLAQKLEKPKPKVEGPDKAKGKTEQKSSRTGTSKSSKTMNRLQSKIAQNKIKDKQKKTQSPSSKAPPSNSVGDGAQIVSGTPKKSVKSSVEATSPSSLPGATVSHLKDSCLRNALSVSTASSVSSSVVHHFASAPVLPATSLSASERLSRLGQSHMPQMSPRALAGLLSAAHTSPPFTSQSGISMATKPHPHVSPPQVASPFTGLPPHLLSSLPSHINPSLMGPFPPQLAAGLAPQWPVVPLLIPGEGNIKSEPVDVVPAPSLAHPPAWPVIPQGIQRSPKKSPGLSSVKQPSPIIDKGKGPISQVNAPIPEGVIRNKCMLQPHRQKYVLSIDKVKKKVKRHSALKVYTMHTSRRQRNATFLPYGIDSSDDDGSDVEDRFPWQRSITGPFSESDDEAHEDDDLDQQITSTIRLTKLDLLRGRLRRHLTEKVKAVKGNDEIRVHSRDALIKLVEAARLDPHAASEALICVDKLTSRFQPPVETSRQHSDMKQRRCLQQVDDLNSACDRLALPYSNHCLNHIMYNVDQQLFDYCTAKFSNNTQCCVPVFDIRHELPLCPEHAAKADNYQKNLESKPKKPRKRTKPSALTRPPKKGKKKKVPTATLR